MDTKGIVMWALFIAVCAVICIVSKRIKSQIEENGIETTGVISRIEDTGDPEEINICYYVRYRTEDGKEIEGLLSNPENSLEVGQQVRLKYHPKYKANARLTDR